MNNSIKLIVVSILACYVSIASARESLSAISINNDAINSKKFTSVVEGVKAKLGSEYQNENYDPYTNAYDDGTEFTKTWTNYTYKKVVVGGETKYEVTYTFSEGAISKNLLNTRIMNSVDIAYNENQLTVIQDSIFPDDSLFTAAPPTPENVYHGMAEDQKSLNIVVAQIDGALVSGNGFEFVDKDTLKTKDLSVYPVYGCARVGYPMNIANKNGDTIGTIDTTVGYGYKKDFSKYGFSVDYAVTPNPSYEEGVWDVTKRYPVTYFDKNDVLVTATEWDQFVFFYAHADKDYASFTSVYDNNQYMMKDSTFVEKVCGKDISSLF